MMIYANNAKYWLFVVTLIFLSFLSLFIFTLNPGSFSNPLDYNRNTILETINKFYYFHLLENPTESSTVSYYHTSNQTSEQRQLTNIAESGDHLRHNSNLHDRQHTHHKGAGRLGGARNQTTVVGGCDPVRFLPPFRRREDIGESLKAFGFKIGAELGVQKGGYLRDLLPKWQIADHYVLVDLWAHQSNDNNYVDAANVGQQEQDKIKAEAIDAAEDMKRLNVLVNFEVCQNFTTVCAEKFPDEHFDFIYVDARHDYKGVLQDLTFWWPKLRKGGVMAGDDYVTMDDLGGPNHGNDWTVNYDGSKDTTGRVVRGAVDDFFSDVTHMMLGCPRQVTISYKERKNYLNTWAVRK